MTPEEQDERTSRLVESLAWRDPDAAVESAEAWYQENRREIAQVRTNQWEWLERMGEGASTFSEYKSEVNRGLNKEGKDPEPGQTPPERRWKQAKLADLLVAELDNAAMPDQGDRMKEFDRLIRAMSGAKRERLGQ